MDWKVWKERPIGRINESMGSDACENPRSCAKSSETFRKKPQYLKTARMPMLAARLVHRAIFRGHPSLAAIQSPATQSTMMTAKRIRM